MMTGSTTIKRWHAELLIGLILVVAIAFAPTIAQNFGNPVQIFSVGSVRIGTTLPVAGTITANVGTSGSLALEAGHLATIDTTTAAGNVLTGAVNETAPASDTASSGLNGRLQRIAQRLTTLIIATGSPFQAGGSIGNTTFGATQGTSPWIVAGGGTAGTAATGVVTIQGIASMTKLLVTPDANAAINVAQINGVTPLMGAGNTGTGSARVTIADNQNALAAWGFGATGAAVPAGAHYIGLNAATALPTAATAGNLTGATADKYGRQVFLPGTVRDLRGTQTTTISASTSETTIVTAAASVFNDLACLIISNTSAATSTRIDIRDDTGGSIIFSLYSVGGAGPVGFCPGGGVTVPQTATNKNWTAQAATSTTDLRVWVLYDKNR